MGLGPVQPYQRKNFSDLSLLSGDMEGQNERKKQMADSWCLMCLSLFRTRLVLIFSVL